MNVFANFCRAAAIVGACSTAPLAWAAASVGIDDEVALPEAVVAPPQIYELDIEIVVRNWVLCVSQGFAEQLARARADGVEQARAAYESLKGERKCGQFAELRVILQTPLYAAAADTDHDPRVFGALVNLSDTWASAFVVTGGLAEE